MIIVILHNQQTNQVNLTYEGIERAAVKQVFAQLIAFIEQQEAMEAAQGNGQPSPRRPSGLIVPPPQIPRNLRNTEPPQ
jgi:hypothetical protein